MKKFSFLLMAVCMLFVLASCGGTSGNTPTSGEPTKESDTVTPSPQNNPTPSNTGSENSEGNESKILIAYFSSAGNITTDTAARGNIGQGNTKALAEMIQEQAGGDLFFIETVNKYSSNYNTAINEAMQELRNNTKPELATHVENMDDYDVIFIGYPNWWGTIPQTILSFAEEYDFAGKTIIPFCTYEDSGIGRSVQDLKRALPDSTFLDEYSVSEHDLANAKDDVITWLTELKIVE